MTILIGTVLKIGNDGMVHILLLLAEELRADTVERIRAQLVVALHVREHIENDTTIDGRFDVGTLTVRRGLEHGLPHFGHAILDPAPLPEDG